MTAGASGREVDSLAEGRGAVVVMSLALVSQSLVTLAAPVRVPGSLAALVVVVVVVVLALAWQLLG